MNASSYSPSASAADADVLAVHLASLSMNPACGPSAGAGFESFKLLATSTDVATLANWWSDNRFGPSSSARDPQSWLLAFPLLRCVEFALDGTVTISPHVSDSKSAEQAQRAKEHIQKVTRKLQCLRCDCCGNEVISRDAACCQKQCSDRVSTTYRMPFAAVDAVFREVWVAADAAVAQQWLALHESSTKDRNGKRILPLLLSRSAAAQTVEQHVIRMLNSMEKDAARLMIHGQFRSRPFTLTATSFKHKHASDFVSSIDISLQSSFSGREPSMNASFGKIIDKQLKGIVKRGVLEKSLPDGWADASPSFGALPLEALRSVEVCQETDALFQNHIVEFKTLETIAFDSRSQRHHDRFLGETLRQMAVSQTVLRRAISGSFLVLIGRDHRVLVLEDVGKKDAAGLPLAFAWLKNTVDYWTHPSQPYSRFLRSFAAAAAPYSIECAKRRELWSSDYQADFSGWDFLNSFAGQAAEQLPAEKSRADAENERRKRQ
jgi:hypothetical protein